MFPGRSGFQSNLGQGAVDEIGHSHQASVQYGTRRPGQPQRNQPRKGKNRPGGKKRR
jgi:hypothetical protein